MRSCSQAARPQSGRARDFATCTATSKASTAEASPLTRSDHDRLFGEWRQGGRLLGLRDEDMPADVDAYWAYYNEMIETKLEYNAVTRHILNGPALRIGAMKRIPAGVWARLSTPVGIASRRVTLGSLPARYRRKNRGSRTLDARG